MGKPGRGTVSIVQKQIEQAARELCQPITKEGQTQTHHHAALVIVPHPLDDNGRLPEGKPPYLIGVVGHPDQLYMAALYAAQMLRPTYWDEPEAPDLEEEEV